MQRTAESLIETGLIDRVLVCNGGGTAGLTDLSRLGRVSVMNCDLAGFSKSRLMNRGLDTIDAGMVLLSDADIIWSRTGLADLIEPVDSGLADFSWIANVAESGVRGGTPPDGYQHVRVGFKVDVRSDRSIIETFPETGPSKFRPGYGLIYGSNRSFRRVGGYKEWSGGLWGWEDVDFIMRSQLLGLTVASAGSVLHLSHGDELRALHGFSRCDARDRNMSISKQDILAGRLLGALAQEEELPAPELEWIDKCIPPKTDFR